MKALTLHQPHATLMALGKKTWETRSWKAPNSLLGHPLAIHAGKKFDREALGSGHIASALGTLLAGDTGLLPLGGIVAVVLLMNCRETTDRDRRQTWAYRPHPKDFGDFSDGRYVWETKLLLRCTPHIVCRGFQGLWNIPASIEAMLVEAINP